MLCPAHGSYSRRRRKEDTRFLTRDGNNSTEHVLGSMVREEAARSAWPTRLQGRSQDFKLRGAGTEGVRHLLLRKILKGTEYINF
jgi:hypothetical protein